MLLFLTRSYLLLLLLLSFYIQQCLISAGVSAQGCIVAEVCYLENQQLMKMVGQGMVCTVVSKDIVGRLMIQCARQPGLAGVWDKIMGFEGKPILL